MKLYVLRHGETEGNVKGIMSGHQESYLTENGREEARKIRDFIQDKNIDLIIASPLIRTKETAEIVSDGKIPILYDDRLKSRNHGEFAGMRRDELNLEDYWNYYKNKQYKEAETAQEIYNRAKSMVELAKEKYPNQNILFVTHSGICRMIYYYVNGIPEDGDMLTGYKAQTGRLEEYEF